MKPFNLIELLCCITLAACGGQSDELTELNSQATSEATTQVPINPLPASERQ